MSTTIATTVRFDGAERATFQRAADWWTDGIEVPGGTRDHLSRAATGEPMDYAQLVGLMNGLNGLADHYRDLVRTAPRAPIAGVWERTTLPAVTDALRIVISLVAMDEVMFGNTAFDLSA
jgi:hypothetical protein